MSDEKPNLDRIPAGSDARAKVAAIVTEQLGADAAPLLRALGDELREVLAFEHEDDLDRIRPAMFDLGVRSALRVVREQGHVDEAREAVLVSMFDAERERHRISELVDAKLTEIGVPRVVIGGLLVELRRELP